MTMPMVAYAGGAVGLSSALSLDTACLTARRLARASMSRPMRWLPRLRPAWWRGTAMTPAARMNWSRAAPSGTGAGPVGVGVRDGGGASAITVRRSAG
jgi:hypothetical protein